MLKRWMYFLLPVFVLSYSFNALACYLYFYVDKNVGSNVVFNAVSLDGKYQYTTGSLSPGTSGYTISAQCITYNIYAQDNVGNYEHKKISTGPYGNYAYLGNPLQLSGTISVFFPSEFQSIPQK